MSNYVYSNHDYMDGWVDSLGQLRKWHEIHTPYLNNIHRKIQRRPNDFQPMALFYCEEEKIRRGLMPRTPPPFPDVVADRRYRQFNQHGFDMAHPDSHYNIKVPINVQINTAALAEKLSEKTMQNSGDIVERPVQLVTRIKDEKLADYFLKKVRYFENGEDYKVISIHAGVSTRRKQLTLMPLKGGSSAIELDAHEVEIVKQIAVYTYQHKNGEITLSSVHMSAAMMKKKNISRLENATKYIDV